MNATWIKRLLLLSCFAVGAFATAFADAPDAWRFRWPALVPAVAEHSFEPTRRVVLDESSTVEVVCGEGAASGRRRGEGAAPCREWVAMKMGAWFGRRPKVREEDAAGRGLPTLPGDEAYELSAKGGAVRISANTMQGVRWAMMTLRQIAQPVRGTFKTTAYEVPEFTVRDRPETSFRAMHLCAFPEVSPTRIERGIRMAAYYKFNYVILESWGTFRSERHPWYGYADGWLTVSECRRLAAMANDLGVTIIPFFNVFGHARAARGKAGKHAALDLSPEYQPLFEPRAGFNWCLANPEARRVTKELVSELYEAFGSPPYVHLGCDEADPPTCAACCAADYGRLLADHVLALADHVRKLGARPMMWHDKLIKNGDPRWKGFEANGSDATVALLDALPKDMIICDWCYYPPPKDGRYPTLDHFRAKGFETMTCPWDDVGGIHAQCDYARRNGMGVVCTTWNHFTAYSVWSIYTHAASCAWSAAAAEGVRAVEREYSSALRDVFDTHWRQVGWDTPGCDRYSETGFFPDQIGTSIGER